MLKLFEKIRNKLTSSQTKIMSKFSNTSGVDKLRNEALQQITNEENRRKKLPIIQEHPTQTIWVKGEFGEFPVEIDKDILPLIDWLNNLKGTFTQFCCQGSIYDPERTEFKDAPYVTWICEDKESIIKILKLFKEFHGNGLNPFHYISTEIDYFDGKLRQTSRWFDNLALKDFIQWAGTNNFLTPTFNQDYGYLGYGNHH